MLSRAGLWVALLVCTAYLVAVTSGQWSPGSTHHKKHNHRERNSKHHHYVPKRQPPGTLTKQKILQDNNLLHDKQHLKEELPDYLPMEKIESMSEKELDYHYFRMHDFDENLRLDGLELLAAIMHVDGEENEGGEEADDVGELKGFSEGEQRAVHSFRQQAREENLKFYVELVDEVMAENDLNNDGYLSWAEFLKGRRT